MYMQYILYLKLSILYLIEGPESRSDSDCRTTAVALGQQMLELIFFCIKCVGSVLDHHGTKGNRCFVYTTGYLGHLHYTTQISRTLIFYENYVCSLKPRIMRKKNTYLLRPTWSLIFWKFRLENKKLNNTNNNL
jgi:hypothetical protein